MWFIKYADIQKTRCGWDLMRSLRAARLLAPELFNDVHDDTPCRWRVSDAGIVAGTCGVVPKLNAAMVSVLRDLVTRVARLVPVSAVGFQTLFEVQLEKLGLTWRPSLSWVRKFFRNSNNSYKAIGKPN